MRCASEYRPTQDRRVVQIVYLLLCIVGTALPLFSFFPWLSVHGLDVKLLFEQATSTDIAAFAWSDVLVSGIAVAMFVVVEARRLEMRRWWLPLACLAVGPSLALPLFLLQRERHLAGVSSARVA
ncbi:DUF2834 domain-containing protein [uncultured Stenotrophomonas sp.]|uniref:DUF2834 domain-containing protein n=1 Tax=uncultured Stenotrophomonas sp. TaxID=165438 RepID=UPI0025EAD520|nr:DUF2834 domain-containing protein [uncultured Stenotrophomonas sp.]